LSFQVIPSSIRSIPTIYFVVSSRLKEARVGVASSHLAPVIDICSAFTSQFSRYLTRYNRNTHKSDYCNEDEPYTHT
jgi:hypothetical protein